MENIVAGFNGNKFMLIDYDNQIEQKLCDFDSYYENLTPFSIEEQKLTFDNLIDLILTSQFTDELKSLGIGTSALLCNYLSKQNVEKTVCHLGNACLNEIYQFLTSKYRKDNQYFQCDNLTDDLFNADILLFNCDSQESVDKFIDNYTWLFKKEVFIVFYGNLKGVTSSILREKKYYYFGEGQAVISGKLLVGKKEFTSMELETYHKIMDQFYSFYESLREFETMLDLKEHSEIRQYQDRIQKAISCADDLEQLICTFIKIIQSDDLKNVVNRVKDSLLNLSYCLDNNLYEMNFYINNMIERKEQFIKILNECNYEKKTKVVIAHNHAFATKILNGLNYEKVNLLGVVTGLDFNSDPNFNHININSSSIIAEWDVDYIIAVGFQFPYDILNEFLLKNNKHIKVIHFFDFNYIGKAEQQTLFLNDWILQVQLNQRANDLKKQFEIFECHSANLPFEMGSDETLQYPKVMSIEETVEQIITRKLSVSRFGDGEFRMMFNEYGPLFQQTVPELAENLRMIVKSNLENHMVAIHGIYGSFYDIKQGVADYYRQYLYQNRKREYLLLDLEKQYGNSFVTRFYMNQMDYDIAKMRFDNIKRIWDKREVVIIEGEKTRLGIGNDLLDNAAHIKRILAPAENAYDKYEEILGEILKLSKNSLILLALGPTATVLAYDLCMAGYQAIDIGHIDIEYEWFLVKAQSKVSIPNKYVNEAKDGKGKLVGECLDNDYRKQIVARVI